MEHCEKDTGKPVFAVGPVCLVNGDGDDTLERGRGGEADTAAEAARVLRWLDTKPARSVVYVCFGSLPEMQRLIYQRPLSLYSHNDWLLYVTCTDLFAGFSRCRTTRRGSS